jgi:hypothetical protein
MLSKAIPAGRMTDMGPRTHYEILGVARDAPHDEIKSAYRKLARANHPDVGGNGALFGLINEAWEVLGDPAKRAQYDLQLSGPQPTSDTAFSGAGPWASDTRRADPRHADASGAGGWAEQMFAEDAAEEAKHVHAEPKRAAAPIRRYDRDPQFWRHRALAGLGVIVWFFVLAGFSWLEAKIFPSVHAPQGVDAGPGSFVLMFLLGAVVLAFPWYGRAAWRPFPYWEQVAVFVSSAAVMPFGWRGLLLLVLTTPVYVLLVARRRTGPRPAKSTSTTDDKAVAPSAG